MANESHLKELTSFFQTARHLWGRCPCCGELFRLSEAVISYGNEPPKDWLTRLQKQKKEVETKKGELDDWQAEVEGREYEVQAQQREIDARQRNLVKEARGLARDMLKDDKKMKKLLTEARREAVQRLDQPCSASCSSGWPRSFSASITTQGTYAPVARLPA